MLVRRALDKRALERQVLRLSSALASGGFEAGDRTFHGMVGRHPEMARIYQLITQVAETPTTVLITGESGTGKELVARAVHRRSCARGPAVRRGERGRDPGDAAWSRSCSATRRAPSPARTRASSGSSSSRTAARCSSTRSARCASTCRRKLLRALQEREIERLGGLRPVPVDVRVLAATNVNLRQAVRERAFREDLYYRLNVVPIQVPAAARAARGHSVPRRALRPEDRARMPSPGATASRPVPWRCSRATTGRATCASWRTSSIARWCSPAAPW